MSKLDEELALAGLDAKTRRWLKRKPKKSKASRGRRADEPGAITPIEYGGLQEAYDFFNTALFEGGLVDVFITYQRHANTRGYFSADRFSGRQLAFSKHELALNPDTFIGRSDEDICSTLVHEMVHCWQHVLGESLEARLSQQGMGGENESDGPAALEHGRCRRQGNRPVCVALHHPRRSRSRRPSQNSPRLGGSSTCNRRIGRETRRVRTAR
jgi:hypothetical protein